MASTRQQRGVCLRWVVRQRSQPTEASSTNMLRGSSAPTTIITIVLSFQSFRARHPTSTHPVPPVVRNGRICCTEFHYIAGVLGSPSAQQHATEQNAVENLTSVRDEAHRDASHSHGIRIKFVGVETFLKCISRQQAASSNHRIFRKRMCWWLLELSFTGERFSSSSSSRSDSFSVIIFNKTEVILNSLWSTRLFCERIDIGSASNSQDVERCFTGNSPFRKHFIGAFEWEMHYLTV